MPRNGSGTMSISNTFVASTQISASPMNANFTDVASEITGSLPRDGQAGMTGQLKAANGTVTAPGMTFGSDTDTGFYRSGTGAMAYAADGVKVLTFDANGITLESGSPIPLASGGTGAELSDPGADRVMFWDDSAGALTWLAAGTGLAISGTTLSLSFFGLESLTDPGADRILMWDDSAGASAWLGLSGLTITGTTLAVDAATSSAAGVIEIATQAEVEAATDTGRATTPGTMHYHPGVAKFWALVTVSGGTPSVTASYNVTSVTDNGTGDLILTIATDFSNANWAVFATARSESANAVRICYEQASSHAAGTTNIRCENSGGTSVDPAAYYIVGFGDHA